MITQSQVETHRIHTKIINYLAVQNFYYDVGLALATPHSKEFFTLKQLKRKWGKEPLNEYAYCIDNRAICGTLYKKYKSYFAYGAYCNWSNTYVELTGNYFIRNYRINPLMSYEIGLMFKILSPVLMLNEKLNHPLDCSRLQLELEAKVGANFSFQLIRPTLEKCKNIMRQDITQDEVSNIYQSVRLNNYTNLISLNFKMGVLKFKLGILNQCNSLLNMLKIYNTVKRFYYSPNLPPIIENFKDLQEAFEEYTKQRKSIGLLYQKESLHQYGLANLFLERASINLELTIDMSFQEFKDVINSDNYV